MKNKLVEKIGSLELQDLPNEEYEDLIEECNSKRLMFNEVFKAHPWDIQSYRTEHSKFWLDWKELMGNNQDLAINFSELEDKILVDLGGGKCTHVSEIANNEGASLLCNVDALHHSSAEGNINRKYPKLEYEAVDEDILSFVSRLPDNSVAISINGIDECIIPIPDYHAALVKEITRAADPETVVFGVQSIVVNLLSEQDFDFVFDRREDGQVLTGAVVVQKKNQMDS